MRIQRITAAVAAAALLLSGCSSLSLNSSDILAPPKAAGDRASIQKMIEDDTDGKYELIFPSSGGHKSGVIMHDLDGDGTDEAVALYRCSDGSARMLIAENRDGGYRSKGTVELSSASIGSLRFADVDGSGREEIIVGCGAEPRSAVLSACFTDEEPSLQTVAEGFTDYLTGDLDTDARSDVLVLIPPSAEASAKAELMIYDKNGFESRSSCEVDPAVASYAALNFGKINGDIYGAILDGVTADGKYTTQILYYDKEDRTLINPLFVAAGYSDTYRTAKVFSADIDADGVTEFPLCSLTEHEKKEDIATVCTEAMWCCYEPVQMAPVKKVFTMLCEPLSFQLRVDEELTRTLTARYDTENGFTLHEVEYKNNEPKIGGAVLTIRRYDAGSFDSEKDTGTVIYEDGTATYACTLTDNAPFTYATVKSSFIPM